MPIELATAYVSLVPETSKIRPGVNKAMDGVQADADKTGQSMGARMAGGLGSVLKASAAGVGLAAGTVVGTALSLGFKRMVAIDDAKGKLAGLGHDAQGVATIMESALASVKGTAYGLGDAATIAASAVAAGVKPGEDLTRYLKLTADAATIAGSSLGDMGAILNKVTTSGKAYTGDLNMLADRGIPIFQWLQDEYRVSADELSDMVKKGEVDSATFQAAIQKNIGGAALESGKTLRGAWGNLQAALGRVGEGALSPFLDMMKGGLAAGTSWADKVAPKVKAGATEIADGLSEAGRAFQSNGASITGSATGWESLGLKARRTVDGIRVGIERLKSAFQGTTAPKFLDKLNELDTDAVFEKIDAAGQGATDTVGKLGESISLLSTSLGVAGAGGISLTAIAIRTLGNGMQFLADHTGLATAATTAFFASIAAGKAIHTAFEASRVAQVIMMPADIASRVAMTNALNAHNAALRSYLASVGQEVSVQQGAIARRLQAVRTWARQTYETSRATAALTIYSRAAAMAAASSNGLNAALLRGASTTAAFGARVQATSATALSGLARASSGLMGMLGGPWGIAMAAAGAAVMGSVNSADSAKRAQEALAQAVVTGAKAHNEFFTAVSQSNGALSASAVKAGTEAVKSTIAETITLGERGHSTIENLSHLLDNVSFDALGANDGWEKDFDKVSGAEERFKSLKAAAQDLKIDLDDVYRATATGGQAFDQIIGKLESSGQAGQDMARELRSARDSLQASADAARNSTPGYGTLADAIKKIADTATTADDRLGAMKIAMDVLSGKPVQLGDAMQSYNRVLRETTEATQDAWDAQQGYGQALINQDGSINTQSANGDKLRTTLTQLRDETIRVAQAGGDMESVTSQNAAAFAALGGQLGLSQDQVMKLAESIGYMPEQISVLARLEGAGSTEAQLVTIKGLLDRNANGVEIPVQALTDEARAKLESTGAKIDEVNGKPGIVKISAPDQPAVLAQLQAIIDKELPDKTQRINIVETRSQALAAQGKPQDFIGPVFQRPVARAQGGPSFGSGGPTSDSIPAMLSHGEHVWTAEEVDGAGGHSAMYNLRALARSGGLRYAEGGAAGDPPGGIVDAIKAARDMEGHDYLWGGIGPTNFDCSGFVSFLQQVAMGMGRVVKRLYTTMTILGGDLAGLKPGLGPAGTWFRVGVSEEHMAGTIAGMPVESGGAHGNSGIGGGRAGAEHSQFPNKYHLPNELIAGASGGGGFMGDASGFGGAYTTGGKLVEWTREDELELLRLQEEVQQKREARAELDGVDEKGKPKHKNTSDSDRRKADLEIEIAQEKVLKKQEQKDKQGTYEGGTRVAPQAPGLKKKYSDEDKAYASALQAVEQANKSRNEVYDDPTSTDADKQLADVKLQEAMEELETGSADSKSGKDKPKSVREIFTNYAANVAGIVFDGLKAQLPDKVGSSHWWNVADQVVSLSSEYGPGAGKDGAKSLDGIPSTFTDTMFGNQLGFSPKREIPDWVMKLKNGESAGPGKPGELSEGKDKDSPETGGASGPNMDLLKRRIRVFDSGGWLPPGEMALNLSQRPEPIFNSPSQLKEFTSGRLDPATPNGGAGLTEQDVEKIMRLRPEYHLHVADQSAAIQQVRVEQRRQAMMHYRR